MLRRSVSVAVIAALGVLGAWLILGNRYPDEGPYVSLSSSHGIHVGDVVVVAVWACCAVLLWRWGGRGATPRRR